MGSQVRSLRSSGVMNESSGEKLKKFRCDE